MSRSEKLGNPRAVAPPATERERHGWGRLGDRLDAIDTRIAATEQRLLAVEEAGRKNTDFAERIDRAGSDCIDLLQARIQALEERNRALDDMEAARQAEVSFSKRASTYAEEAAARAAIAKTFAPTLRGMVRRAVTRAWKHLFSTARSTE